MGMEFCKKKRQSNLKGYTIFKNDEFKNFQSKEEFNLLFNKQKVINFIMNYLILKTLMIK